MSLDDSTDTNVHENSVDSGTDDELHSATDAAAHENNAQPLQRAFITEVKLQGLLRWIRGSRKKSTPRSSHEETWRCKVQGRAKAISCTRAPWDHEKAHRGEAHAIRRQTRLDVVPVSAPASPTGKSRAAAPTVADDRTRIWALAQLAASGAVPESSLFRVLGRGKPYTLRPFPRSAVPLQWVHTGPRAIPDSLADAPCADIDEVLRNLNTIMGTRHTLRNAGMRAFLEHAVALSRDFGEVYGRARPWWLRRLEKASASHFDEARAQMQERAREDEALRHAAVQHGSVEPAALPPRRVWDLLSNRVLPYSTLRSTQPDSCSINDALWAVSHSWVAEADRADVWTNINGRLWRVPLPRATTLEHVRVELLNAGAEYVWLDVLCLRHPGRAEDEELRAREWSIDIPTAGQVFRERRTVTYFNGLGLPFTTAPDILESENHWLSRVRMLQQTTPHWLPGGLTGGALPDARPFFARLEGLVARTLSWDAAHPDATLLHELKTRHCTSQHERIAAFAHWLAYGPVPAYDEHASPEAAWRALLAHMHPVARTDVFLRYAADAPFAPCVSYAGFRAHEPALPPVETAGVHNARALLRMEDRELLGGEDQRFCHSVHAAGPCFVVRRGDASDAALALDVHFDGGGVPVKLERCMVHGILLPDVPYTLLFALGAAHHIVVVDIFGTAEGPDGEQTFEAVKWGVIHVGGGVGTKLVERAERKSVAVAYLGVEEARRRSLHTRRCVQELERMRGRGEIRTFGAAVLGCGINLFLGYVS
ncbi:hypothetical protein PsYK624_114160 [Phanerochaete sordida]|uniref:Heterokaryon incompatibility domain-containing protein n=1 Tax=Phanerochaete sordida TaxID=48140 RepID=A0A9P3GJ70_9APHY|nr:hypothetical protein PsYK624_114160 [Phanerochaete sordida]